MTTPIAVDDEVITAFQQLKSHQHGNYVIYALAHTMDQIIVAEAGTAQTHDDFVDRLPRSEPRYVVYNLKYTQPGNDSQQSKILLISWCPEDTTLKKRMVHHSSCTELRNRLEGVAVFVTATDYSDVAYDELVSQAA